MKKTILTLACFFTLLFAAQSQMVITEIMYNPPESGTDSLEYIEFYNNSNAAVNMENWTLFGVVFTFPATTVPPGGYVLVAVKSSTMQNQFGVSALQWTSGGLNNGGETIRLLNAAGATVDEVTYSSASPWPPEANAGGASLVLCDPNSDNSLPGNWKAATSPTGITINNVAVFANPGAAAICGPLSLQATDDQAIAASGQALKIAVLANDVQPNPLSGPIIVVTTPAHGNAVVNPDNTITYTSNAGYCGDDQFEYQVCDADGCDIGVVSVKVKCYTAHTIAQVTTENTDGVADSVGVNCEMQGTVYGVNIRPVNNNQPALLFTLIDDNGDGIAVSSLSGNYGYTVKEKDKIKVRGTIGQFQGLTEIQPDFIDKLSADNPLLAPLTVTQLDEATESKLIKINNLHFVDPAEWTTGVGASGFNVRVVSDNHPLDTIQLRIDRDVELYNQPVPPQPFDLTGIGGQFDNTSPYTSGYQVLPRYNPDISTLVAVKETDFSAFVRMTPNPVSDQLLLQTEVQFERVRIFAASGVLMKALENPAQTQEIQVSTLPSGLYFIQFEKNGAAWATRFVKQ